MTEYNALNEALTLAEFGLPVFPLTSLSKIPTKQSKGFKEATTDEFTIKKMFKDDTNHNIGLSLVGTPYFVIDVDNHKTDKQEGLRSLKKLLGDKAKDVDDVVSVKTANGGLHLYFKYPETYEVKQRINFMPSLDIIKNYIVAPPSVVQRKNGTLGKYEIENGSLAEITEAPPFLLDLVTGKTESQNGSKKRVKKRKKKVIGKTWTASFLEELVQGEAEGGRNIWIASKVGKLLSLGMASSEAYQLIHAVNSNFVYPPLSDSEVNKIFQSILQIDDSKEGE